MIIQKIHSIFHPEQFQGWNRNRNYFEGWYFKIVNEDETKAFAIIPGTSTSVNTPAIPAETVSGKNRFSPSAIAITPSPIQMANA